MDSLSLLALPAIALALAAVLVWDIRRSARSNEAQPVRIRTDDRRR